MMGSLAACQVQLQVSAIKIHLHDKSFELRWRAFLTILLQRYIPETTVAFILIFFVKF